LFRDVINRWSFRVCDDVYFNITRVSEMTEPAITTIDQDFMSASYTVNFSDGSSVEISESEVIRMKGDVMSQVYKLAKERLAEQTARRGEGLL
jgi:exosome complex RNA-binding protein Rrp4